MGLNTYKLKVDKYVAIAIARGYRLAYPDSGEIVNLELGVKHMTGWAHGIADDEVISQLLRS